MYTRIRSPLGSGFEPAISRDADGLVIAPDPNDPLWQDYQDWLLAGNTPSEPPASAASTEHTFLGFMGLFTAAEQAAIVSSTDPQVKLFCLMAAGASYVDLSDPRVIAGSQLLESLGLIGKGRAVQVLAGQAPPAS